MPIEICLQTKENEGTIVNISSSHSVKAFFCIEIGSLSVVAESSVLPAKLSVPNKLIGMQFIQSMSRYATNFAKLTELVNNYEYKRQYPGGRTEQLAEKQLEQHKLSNAIALAKINFPYL